MTVTQSVIISRNPRDNLSIFLLKISSYTNNYHSVENMRILAFIRQIFLDWLSFLLHMVFLEEIFRKVRGLFTEVAIQRSFSKQAFPKSRQNP